MASLQEKVRRSKTPVEPSSEVPIQAWGLILTHFAVRLVQSFYWHFIFETSNLSPIKVIHPTQTQQPSSSRDFDRKPLEKIKLYPQKRINTLDSPTLREIANQNAKKLRVDGKLVKMGPVKLRVDK